MNNKKIVAEIILVPVCIVWLLFMVLKSSLAAGIIFAVFALITAVWFSPKYFNDVYVYKSKGNIFKLIVAIVDILLFIVSILTLILKLKVLKIVLVVLAVISFIHLVYFFVKNLKEIMNKKKDFNINILYSFFSFLLFLILAFTLIIYLK